MRHHFQNTILSTLDTVFFSTSIAALFRNSYECHDTFSLLLYCYVTALRSVSSLRSVVSTNKVVRELKIVLEQTNRSQIMLEVGLKRGLNGSSEMSCFQSDRMTAVLFYCHVTSRQPVLFRPRHLGQLPDRAKTSGC